ncbi:hypothetical protein C943_04306 [Mariniradius saccharolyticus AK6]|uniref:Uncharacterized protein n=1 Tax=Mariniradius saccharolyticus AK6 TaxID=1239962 RepID=M7XFW9_9BACT|nr:hypothetical protein C943_04306 [Mariniradius saccharolyticus AK6]
MDCLSCSNSYVKATIIQKSIFQARRSSHVGMIMNLQKVK